MAQNSTDHPDITVLLTVVPVPRNGPAFILNYSTSDDGETPNPGSGFDPKEIEMNRNGKITFKIDPNGPPGWTFPDNAWKHLVMPSINRQGLTTTDFFYGVTITTPGDDATLSGFGRSEDGTSVWVTDGAPGAEITQSRSYEVKVCNLASGQTASFDPTIKDQAA